MSEASLQIFQITPDLLELEETRRIILTGPTELYWTTDWSPDFYIQLAKQGFITTAILLSEEPSFPVLLPEIQRSYAILDWKNRRMSRSMKRWMASEDFGNQEYRLSLYHELKPILDGIHQIHGPNCWVIPSYQKLLQTLIQETWDNFEIIPVGLVNSEGQLIAGEIGYRIGNTYTSLTGFHDRSERVHNHAGKLQLHLLAQHFEKQGLEFWNLGHPGMQYKTDMGAMNTQRDKFLKRWEVSAVNKSKKH